MTREQLKVLRGDEVGQAVGSGAQVEQTAAFRFRYPCVVIAVSVEYYALVLAYHAADEVVQCGGEVGCAFKLVGIESERLCDRGVEHDVGGGDGGGGAEHTEFEFIAGERKRRGAVAVGRVARQLGQNVHSELERGGLCGVVAGLVFYRIENGTQLVAEEHRNDSGRRLVCAEAVVVARSRNRNSEQILVLVNRAYNGG